MAFPLASFSFTSVLFSFYLKKKCPNSTWRNVNEKQKWHARIHMYPMKVKSFTEKNIFEREAFDSLLNKPQHRALPIRRYRDNGSYLVFKGHEATEKRKKNQKWIYMCCLFCRSHFSVRSSHCQTRTLNRHILLQCVQARIKEFSAVFCHSENEIKGKYVSGNISVVVWLLRAYRNVHRHQCDTNIPLHFANIFIGFCYLRFFS